MARRFGAGDYLSAPSPTAFNLLAATVSFWFRGTTDSSHSILAAGRTTVGDLELFDINVGDGRTGTLTNEIVTFARRNDANSTYELMGFTTTNRGLLFDGRWHHVALVFTGSANGTSIYIDGVSRTVTLGSVDSGKLGHATLVPTTLLVGAANAAGTITRTPGGNELAWLTVRNAALAAAEVSAEAGGAPPPMIRPAAIVECLPLRGMACDGPERGLVRGGDFQVRGTSWAPGPPIDWLPPSPGLHLAAQGAFTFCWQGAAAAIVASAVVPLPESKRLRKWYPGLGRDRGRRRP